MASCVECVSGWQKAGGRERAFEHASIEVQSEKDFLLLIIIICYE